VAETGNIFETLALFPSVNDSGTVAFAATRREGGGAIVTVKDGRSTVIDPEGAFESFRGALIDGAGSVVRIATPRGGSVGLFAGPDPEAESVTRRAERAEPEPSPYPREGVAVFSQTETCLVLSLVNGSRFQPLQRSRSVIPASRAIRSSSDGHT
jgi:hypothetical protein